MPRRSTRERRSVIANDYIVYFQEHEFDIGPKDNATSLNEAKLSVYFTKWSNAMKVELKSMKDNDVWDLVELPKGKKNQLVVNECSIPSRIQKTILKGIRHILSQRDSLKERALTIR